MGDAFDDLQKEARKLNIPINSGIYKPRDQTWVELQITEYELHRRIKEARRFKRDQWLFFIAVVSSLAAVLSSTTALIALLQKF